VCRVKSSEIEDMPKGVRREMEVVCEGDVFLWDVGGEEETA
jgi:hypothetical protein